MVRMTISLLSCLVSPIFASLGRFIADGQRQSVANRRHFRAYSRTYNEIARRDLYSRALKTSMRRSLSSLIVSESWRMDSVHPTPCIRPTPTHCSPRSSSASKLQYKGKGSLQLPTGRQTSKVVTLSILSGRWRSVILAAQTTSARRRVLSYVLRHPAPHIIRF